MCHFDNFLPPPPFHLYNLLLWCKGWNDNSAFSVDFFIEVSFIMPDGLLKSLPNSCGITHVCFLEMLKIIYLSNVVFFFVFLLFSSQHTRRLAFVAVILFLIFYQLLNSQERSLGEMEKWWLVYFFLDIFLFCIQLVQTLLEWIYVQSCSVNIVEQNQIFIL